MGNEENSFVIGLLYVLGERHREFLLGEGNLEAGIESAVDYAKERGLAQQSMSLCHQDLKEIGKNKGILDYVELKPTTVYSFLLSRSDSARLLGHYLNNGELNGFTAKDFRNIAQEFMNGFRDPFYDRQNPAYHDEDEDIPSVRSVSN